MAELCPDCPVKECQRIVDAKIDTPAKRLAQGWLAFLKANIEAGDGQRTQPQTSKGEVEFDPPKKGEVRDDIEIEYTSCCSEDNGALYLPDHPFVHYFEGDVSSDFPSLDAGGNLIQDLSGTDENFYSPQLGRTYINPAWGSLKNVVEVKE